MEQVNLISILIAGAFTGGLSCFAVQGGLLTTAIAHTAKANVEGAKPSALKSVAVFVTSKIATYTLLGALLGLFGSFFSISPTIQGWIQLVVAIYMLGIALQLLNVHPIFRYFHFQPPATLQRLVRKVAKGNDELTTPALLGVLTLVIPCGTTLAMEALAISTGNPFMGALVMFLFTLSSSWIFFAAGYTASQLNLKLQSYFYKITASVLVLLALISFNGALNLLGSPYAFETITDQFNTNSVVLGSESTPKPPADFETIQRIKIKVTSNGYQADTKVLRKGVPVELTLESKNSYSCANAFSIPSMNIQKILPTTGREVITFIPEKAGTLAFSCSMGMYRGNFMVQ